MPGIDPDFLCDTNFVDLGHSAFTSCASSEKRFSKKVDQASFEGLHDKITSYINSLKEFEMPSMQSDSNHGFFTAMRDYSWSRLMVSGDGPDRMTFAWSFECDGEKLEKIIKNRYISSKKKFIAEGIDTALLLGYESLQSYMKTHGAVFTRGFYQTYQQFYININDLRDHIGWHKRIFDKDGNFDKEFMIWMQSYLQ